MATPDQARCLCGPAGLDCKKEHGAPPPPTRLLLGPPPAEVAAVGAATCSDCKLLGAEEGGLCAYCHRAAEAQRFARRNGLQWVWALVQLEATISKLRKRHGSGPFVCSVRGGPSGLSVLVNGQVEARFLAAGVWCADA